MANLVAPKDRLTTGSHIDTTAREVDFVSRFARNWESLREIMGVSRLIRKTPGTMLKSKYAVVTLQSGAVSEGAEIPYSQAEVKSRDYAPIDVEKFAKGVSIEAINEHGYEDAIGMTDDQFMYELQADVTGRFYDFVNTGTLTSVKTSFQSALAEAQGRVRNKFRGMKKGITEIVGWCNILDAYDYLGAASITVQNSYGMNYIEDFMGYRRLFLCSEDEIPSGTVVATPVENLILYYVSPDDSDFARAGLSFTTDDVTGIIGFHTQGNYNTAVSEAFALMGITLLAEYIDGIAVVTFKTTGSLETITATSAAGTTSGTKLTVTAPSAIPADWTLYFAAKATSAYASPSYLDPVPSAYSEVAFVSNIADNVSATNNHKGRLIATNGAGQVIAASGEITVTA